MFESTLGEMAPCVSECIRNLHVHLYISTVGKCVCLFISSAPIKILVLRFSYTFVVPKHTVSSKIFRRIANELGNT